MPLVPTTVSSMIAATVWGPSTMIVRAGAAGRARTPLPRCSRGRRSGTGRGPRSARRRGMPGSFAQRRGSPVSVIEPGRRAVVAAVGGEHLVAAGVHARQAHRVLDRLGAAVGEEHHVEVAGRELGDQPRRLAAHVVGEARRDRAQPAGLLLDRRDELRVLVADVDVDQLAREAIAGPCRCRAICSTHRIASVVKR